MNRKRKGYGYILGSVLVVFFCGGLNSQALAQCPPVSNLAQNVNNSVVAHSRVGQSFTALCAGNITTVTVVYNTIPPSNQDRVLKIRDGALPTSPVLHSQVIPKSSMVLGANVFTITAPVPMNAFEVNSWEITDATQSGFAADGISHNASGAYAGGNAWFVPVAPTTYDITFAVQIGPVCVTSIGTDTRTACDSLVWVDANTYYTNNNTATYLMSGAASNGCDSMVTLDLTIVNSVTGTDTRTECDSFVWIDANTYYASNNTATYNLVGAAANGCDSLVTLDLTITHSATATDTRTACDSLVWIDANTYYTSNNSTTYTMVGAAANGCDSIITLDLTITNSATATDTRTACDSLVWIDANTYYADNNTATYTLVGAAANGCDSIITLNLTVETIDNNVAQNGLTLTSNENNATYQWLNCALGNQPISGEIGQSFTPTTNGNYAVAITKNGCTDTSTCKNFTALSIPQYLNDNTFALYPNPAHKNLQVNTNQAGTLYLMNQYGKVVYQAAIFKGANSITIPEVATGIYFYQFSQNEFVLNRGKILISK